MDSIKNKLNLPAGADRHQIASAAASTVVRECDASFAEFKVCLSSGKLSAQECESKIDNFKTCVKGYTGKLLN